MISGETRGAGGPGLSRHLENTQDGQRVQYLAARHLAAVTLAGQIREIVLGARGNRTTRPILHIHIDPPAGHQTPEIFRAWIVEFEQEFDLAELPRTGVFHIGKDGADRRHAHLVYGLVRPSGRVVDLKNSYRRREKVSVIIAARFGLPPPPIPRPGSVLKALVTEGRDDVARWMQAAYPAISAGQRIAACSPTERHIAERTGEPRERMLAVIADAWPAQSAIQFRKQLAASGFAIGMGDKVPVIVDRTGTPHALARTVRSACRLHGMPLPRAAFVHSLVADIRLPSVGHVNRIREMAKASKPQAKTKAATGQDIVAGFGSRVRMVRKGPPHRIALQDGGWVVVDSKTRTLRISGKYGDADSLAKRLAALEDYSIERIQRRRLKRTATWSFSAGADQHQDEAKNGRFDWWVSRGYTPELRAGGVAVEIDGTTLLDRGAVIEVHTLPPSDRALDEIARYAAANWSGSLVLSGPPGSVDWSPKDKERLWLACQRCGVEYSGYIPSAKLLRRWDVEREGDGQGGAVATSAPLATTEVPLPSARSPVSQASRMDKIDAEIAVLKGQWSRYARDPDRIETMRGEIARLEGLRSELLGRHPEQDQDEILPPPRTPGA